MQERLKPMSSSVLPSPHRRLTSVLQAQLKPIHQRKVYLSCVALRLGLIGDEFKTARKHLLDHLEGCIAWKDPAQAERQKERLREKREAERIQAAEAEQQPTEEIVLEAEDEESPAFTMSM